MSAEPSAFARFEGRLSANVAPALLHAAVPGLLVLVTALAGIALRPHTGLLSAFWGANAVLLALMLRRRDFATPLGWISGVTGFLVADAWAGSDPVRILLLTMSNMTGVIAGYLVLRRAEPDDLALRKASSALHLVAGTAAAAIAAGLAGAVAHRLLFGSPLLEGFTYWFVTEFANYIAILPVLLTVTLASRRAPQAGISPQHAMPLLVTLVGLLLEPVIGGPGALAFAVPGLLWCALTYSVAATAFLTFLFAMWTFVTLTMGLGPFFHPMTSEHDLISLRLGVTLVALAPITVATVMSARNAMLREAAAARAAAEDGMASRSLLLATMTHELRSPLGAMIGLAEVMGRQSHGPLGDARYLDYAGSIAESGRHLNTLVTDLLDTAKVEAGRIELAKEPVSSRQLVDQSLCLVRGLAMDARVSLTVVPGDWPDVYVDARAVKQVLINLMSNAIKFSPRGATVTVAAESGPSRMTVRVSDTGRGIAPEDLKLLGQAWTQAGETAIRRRGSGLGLALSMQLVAQHGGQLRLESMQGVGTSAFFDLPRDV